MFIYKKNNIGLLLSLLMLLFGTACSVSPEIKTIDEQPQSNSPDYVSITALELAQLKDAAMQWQQAREGIERILRLEKEITYLVNHIDIINSKAIAQSNQGYSSKSVRSPRNTRNVKSRQQVKQNYSNKKQTVKLNKPKHVFALQVASVDSEQGVAKAWQELNTKAAPLFRDK
ncbi:MAG: SPOR domain-containing protein, partial [Pseudoalteromonas distincta]